MAHHLSKELLKLRQRISTLAELVIGQLDDALEALLHADAAKADRVLERDTDVDQEEVAIEEECLKVIALHQPVTRDLRFLVAVLKINNDIERVGDHAVNLGYIGRTCARKDIPPFPAGVIQMGRLVSAACRNTVAAFIDEDIDAALAICHDDRQVDALYRLIYDEAKRQLHDGRGTFGHAIRLYRIGRELERVGDLLKNIAEDTIYLITGEVVRHNRMHRLSLDATRTEN